MSKLKSVWKKNNIFPTLKECAANRRVLAYAIDSLEITLKDIGISSSLRETIKDILIRLNLNFTNEALFSKACLSLIETWDTELNKTYSIEYEKYRKAFYNKNAFEIFGEKPYARCLDIGCGRGLVSNWLVDKDVATKVWGVDIVPFERDWKLLEKKDYLRFSLVDHKVFEDWKTWFNKTEPFDCAILFWVLHHSSPDEAKALLKGLSETQEPGFKVIVIEDSFFVHEEPEYDPNGFWQEFKDLNSIVVYENVTCAWQAQALLDFIAVRILARYHQVTMPFNYLEGEKWIQLFRDFGFLIEDSSFIGFPAKRDIAVPQVVLSFKLG